MEVTAQKASVNQIDFFKLEGEPFANVLYRFFPEKPSGTTSSSFNSKELDLSLKLSLAGSYGQNQNVEEMPLTRSSTIAGEINFMGINGVQGNSSAPSLDRSSSLPLEAERALVRFGDLQTMRRAETGKRWLQDRLRRAETAEAKISPAAAAASMVPATSPVVDKLKMLANPNPSGKSSMLDEGTFVTDSYNMPPGGLAQVGASSNMPASTDKAKEIVVPLKTMLKEKPPMPADTENPSKRPKLMGPCGLRSDDLKILRKMPSVTTTGDGPGRKRIQGFLYNYRKGQVYIVCVCHGHFLSPAEFVMHAGGTDVANPMKHITVHSHSF